MPNTIYKVVITETAERQLDYIISYVLYEFCDRLAAQEIYQEAQEARHRLSFMPASYKISDDENLAKYNYRIIRFKKHKYLMAFRIVDKEVIVDGIYHSSQNYREDLLDRI